MERGQKGTLKTENNEAKELKKTAKILAAELEELECPYAPIAGIREILWHDSVGELVDRKVAADWVEKALKNSPDHYGHEDSCRDSFDLLELLESSAEWGNLHGIEEVAGTDDLDAALADTDASTLIDHAGEIKELIEGGVVFTAKTSEGGSTGAFVAQEHSEICFGIGESMASSSCEGVLAYYLTDFVREIEGAVWLTLRDMAELEERGIEIGS